MKPHLIAVNWVKMTKLLHGGILSWTVERDHQDPPWDWLHTGPPTELQMAELFSAELTWCQPNDLLHQLLSSQHGTTGTARVWQLLHLRHTVHSKLLRYWCRFYWCNLQYRRVPPKSASSPLTSNLRGSAVESRSLASVLSPSCARPVADRWPLMWVSRPL